MHAFILELHPVVFKHFRVSLAAYVIIFHLIWNIRFIFMLIRISFSISTLKIIFLILLPIFCKKMKHASFLVHFGKRIEDKWVARGRVG